MTILRWAFSPADILEDPLTLSVDGTSVSTGSGVATATLRRSDFLADIAVRHRIEEALRAQLDAAGLVEGVRVELQYDGREDLDVDGRRHVFIEIRTGAVVADELRADICATDSDGNIVDTRAARIAAKRRLGDLLARHLPDDAILRAAVASFSRAMAEPNVVLVRLYEVTEAIRKRFGGAAAAARELGVPVGHVRRLGDLANNLPVRQGRHNGKHAEELRDATGEEVREATDIAERLIVAYAEHLDRRHGGA